MSLKGRILILILLVVIFGTIGAIALGGLGWIGSLRLKTIYVSEGKVEVLQQRITSESPYIGSNSFSDTEINLFIEVTNSGEFRKLIAMKLSEDKETRDFFKGASVEEFEGMIITEGGIEVSRHPGSNVIVFRKKSRDGRRANMITEKAMEAFLKYPIENLKKNRETALERIDLQIKMYSDTAALSHTQEAELRKEGKKELADEMAQKSSQYDKMISELQEEKNKIVLDDGRILSIEVRIIEPASMPKPLYPNFGEIFTVVCTLIGFGIGGAFGFVLWIPLSMYIKKRTRAA